MFTDGQRRVFSFLADLILDADSQLMQLFVGLLTSFYAGKSNRWCILLLWFLRIVDMIAVIVNTAFLTQETIRKIAHNIGAFELRAM